MFTNVFQFTGNPTSVDVNLNVRSMGPVSETDMVSQLFSHLL